MTTKTCNDRVSRPENASNSRGLRTPAQARADYNSSSFEPPRARGTAVTAPWLKIRFCMRVIFMRDLQCGSGQLCGRSVEYGQQRIPTSTYAISASVVIQSFGCVALCFAARSGRTAPEKVVKFGVDLRPSHPYLGNRQRSLDQGVI